METALITINPTEYGLTPEIANNILKDLPAILDERAVLIDEYKRIITLDIDDPATAMAAKENRINIKNNRTKGIETWHKVNKEYFLRGGQFIDAIKRKEVAENERMENALFEIETYKEIKEKKRIADLQLLRQTETGKYEVDGTLMPLGQMAESIWTDYISGVRLNYEQKKVTEKKAEDDRIAKEKAELEERKRIMVENEKLKAENAAKEEQITKERAKAEAEAAKAEVNADAKLKAEREEKEKLQAEISAKAKTEKKAIEDAEAKAEAEANAGDAEKMQMLITDLQIINKKYQFKSKKNQKIYARVQETLIGLISQVTNNK